MNSNLSRVSFSIPRFSWLNPTCPLKPYILFLSEIPYVVAWNSVCIYVYIYIYTYIYIHTSSLLVATSPISPKLIFCGLQSQFLRIGWEELQEPPTGWVQTMLSCRFSLTLG
jgi:hypothetical protein